MRWVFLVLLSACAAPEGTRSQQDELGQRGAWQKQGVVRGLPDDGVLAPSALRSDGILHLWFTQKVGTRQTLLHATSGDDGASFAEPEAVTGLGEGSAYATAWREGAAFHLLYGSGSVHHATSADGVHFTGLSTVLSASFVSGRFDALSIVYPSRTEDGFLFFSGYDGQRLRIGRALPNATGYAVDPPSPILDVSDGFDNTAVSQPCVRHSSAGGAFTMLYGGYDTSLSNPGPYRIGAATSTDGITWTKQGVAIDLSTNGTDAWSTRDPAFVDDTLLFYVGMGDDGHYRLHRAIR